MHRLSWKPSFSHYIVGTLFTLIFALLQIPVASAQAAKKFPVIPGFERFYEVPGSDAVKAGHLLLGELNCTSCHKASGAQAALLIPRQAPVLTEVGSRVKRSYLRKFLENPHAVKAGTAMPNVLGNLPAAQRKDKIEALVHFLSSTGTLRHEGLQYPLVSQGRQLYHQLGCVACHGTRNGDGKADKVIATSVPLGDLATKYTIPSLTTFLANPLHSRPSARMPGLLDNKEAHAVANYLLQDIPAPPPNLTYAYYEGNFGNLPNFDKLKPKTTGKMQGFDLRAAQRGNNYALKFEGYLKIERDGQYRFFTRSDDGSRIVIDGKTVVNNDGTHAPASKSGTARLKKGMHKLVVTFFQGPGGAELRVEGQGPNLPRQELSSLVYLTKEGDTKLAKPGQKDDENFTLNPQLVAKGRQFFTSMGCASCHQMKVGGKELVSTFKAPPLAMLKSGAGCLAETPGKNVPHFDLKKSQRVALVQSLQKMKNPPARKLDVHERIARTLTTFNCYACHERGKVGGPQEELEKFFTTTQPEMGDEGRIPPALNGVGAKLQTAYFKQILANGADDRPYMHTRMPKFGLENTEHLVEDFAKVDTLPPVKKVTFKVNQVQVRSAARFMVSGKAFGCIKCHTFAGNKAEGVQGIDMTIMTKRVKHDWFRHYLLNPQKFRPGTRMPTAWPDGESLLPKILGGDADKQMEAIWVYLSAGRKAALPPGVTSKFIELIPDKEAIIYRNFIAGGGSRAIGVGYPEQANLAFDANNIRLALIWQGAFIDAAKHWNGRGVGYQGPLGGNILHLPDGATFAILDKADQPWPNQAPKELGYKFRGYRLTKDQRPTFLYSFKDIQVEDFPNPTETKRKITLKRTLTLKADRVVMNLYYRAVVAKKIEPQENGWYRIDSNWRTHIDSAAPPRIREIGGNTELLVPVQLGGKAARIVQVYEW